MSKKFWQLSSFIVVYVHSFYCLLSQLQYILYSWVQNWRLEKCKIRQLKYELIILFLIAIFSCVAHSWVMKVKKVTQLYDRLPFFSPSWMREKIAIKLWKNDAFIECICMSLSCAATDLTFFQYVLKICLLGARLTECKI